MHCRWLCWCIAVVIACLSEYVWQLRLVGICPGGGGNSSKHAVSLSCSQRLLTMRMSRVYVRLLETSVLDSTETSQWQLAFEPSESMLARNPIPPVGPNCSTTGALHRGRGFPRPDLSAEEKEKEEMHGE